MILLDVNCLTQRILLGMAIMWLGIYIFTILIKVLSGFSEDFSSTKVSINICGFILIILTAILL